MTICQLRPTMPTKWTGAAEPRHAAVQMVLFLSSAVVLALLYGIGVYLPGFLSSAVGIAFISPLLIMLLKRDAGLFRASAMFGLWYSYGTLPLWLHYVFPASYVSYHSRQFQTEAIFLQVGHLVLIGWLAFLGGSRIGELLSRTSLSRSVLRALPGNTSISTFGATIVSALVFGVMVLPTQPVWVTGYRRGTGIGSLAEGMQLNTIKAGGYLFLLLALIIYTAKPTRGRAIVVGVVSGFLIIGAGLLGGNRVEEIGYILAAAGILSFTRRLKRIPKQWVMLGITLLTILIVTGIVRGVLPELLQGAVPPDVISDTVRTALPTEDDRYIQLGTAGDVTGTMCVVVGMLESGVFQHDGGVVFVNYLRQTLPAVLYPGRPRQLQEQLSDWKLSNGGLFVLAEPYLAWGAFGVAGVLCVTGILMGYVGNIVYRVGDNSRAQLFCNAVLVFSLPRTILYGAFNLYKFALTAAACMAVVVFSSRLAAKRHGIGPIQRAAGLTGSEESTRCAS